MVEGNGDFKVDSDGEYLKDREEVARKSWAGERDASELEKG